MRIAQVSPYFHPHVGGVESHVRDLSANLARRGHDVTVLTSMFEPLPAKERMGAFKVRRLKPLGIWFSTPVTPRLTAALRGGRYDVVHVHWPPPLDSYFAARAKRPGGPPLLMTYHCDLELKVPMGRRIVSLYNRTFADYALSRTDAAIVTTHGYGATSRSVWNMKTYVIPNAVDSETFNPEVDGAAIRDRYGLGDAPTVLYVGRQVHHKGIEHLIEAMTHLPPETRLLVVGEGPSSGYFRERAKECGVAGRIVFAGRVPFTDLPKCYAACDCFVLPSVSRLEAFGIVALEAMSTGKPVVVSNIPGVNEVIEDGVHGLLSEPVNPADLARKVGALLADPAKAKAMGAKGRERVLERFRMATVAEQVEGAYGEVVAAKAIAKSH